VTNVDEAASLGGGHVSTPTCPTGAGARRLVPGAGRIFGCTGALISSLENLTGLLDG
jgi:hypothetical protein